MFKLGSSPSTSPYARHGCAVRVVYLLISGLYWLLLRLTRKPGGIVVLCYHSVRSWQVRLFAWQMRHVAPRALSLAAADRQRRTPGDWPRVCVTFDDGFEGVLKYALPAMEALQVPATVFAVPAHLGTQPGWAMPADHPERGEKLAGGADLAAAVNSNLCSVGSHTLSHPRLRGLPAARLLRELSVSRKALEALFNSSVTDLAFPYGEYDAETVMYACSLGYRRLFTLEPRLWRAGRRPTLVGRFLVSPDMWRIEFVLTCAGAYAWLSGWRRCVRRVLAVRPVRRAVEQEAVAG